MLFGGYDYEQKILNEAFGYAKENNLKLVYGAMVGGISKGLQNYDSDYDTRFLYINNDFPRKIYIPQDYKESQLIKRYYPDEDELYEWIPFWEATSFFSFLANPVLDKKFSIGLFGVVLWTMMSPYTWDPYGIQNKLNPFINSFFNRKLALEYYKTQLISQMKMGNESIILIKRYLYAIHAACSLEWVINYNSMPPVYLKTLVLGVKVNGVREEIECLINRMHIQAMDLKEHSTRNQMHQTHVSLSTPRIEVIENYINKILTDTERVLIECTDYDEKQQMVKVNEIYQLLYQALNEVAIDGI